MGEKQWKECSMCKHKELGTQDLVKGHIKCGNRMCSCVG